MMTTESMLTAQDVIHIAKTNPGHAQHLLRTIAWQPAARERIRAALAGAVAPSTDAPRSAQSRWAQAGFQKSGAR